MKDGRLKMILKVADNDELVGWVLSFGGQVGVAGPEALRQKVKDEAKKYSVRALECGLIPRVAGYIHQI